MHGRKEILTWADEITPGTVVGILKDAAEHFVPNQLDIKYLYNYYRGIQPILGRHKEIREEIMNIVVENRANEIVTFKSGYLVGEPIKYVGAGSDTDGDPIEQLNDFMSLCSKETDDMELVTWMHIAGTGLRMVMPSDDPDEDDAPFKTYVLDPRFAFVVRYDGLGKPPVMAVKFVEREVDGVRSTLYSVWTKDTYYEILEDKIVYSEPNILRRIPVIEYPLNNARLGSFEIVLTLLDSLNTLDSSRVDDVEQTVQSMMVFKNIRIDGETFTQMKELGALQIEDVDPSKKADVEYISAQLDQPGTQTLKEDLYESILTICGMPNRNGGTSTSDTGTAVVLRDGWSAAESRAKETEQIFIRSEREFLRVVLDICRTFGALDLRAKDIDIKFTRRNYEAVATKSTVLTQMLATDKIHPRLAFIQCGMFSDPEAAYKESQEYFDARQEEIRAQQQEQMNEAKTNGGNDSED